MLLAFTLYQFSIGLHAIFAISFLGVAGANGVLGPMSREHPENALFALKVSRKIHKTLIVPGAIGVFVTGLYMWIDGPWNSSDLWLMIGVALFFVMFFLGIFVLSKSNEVAIDELENQAEPGPPSALFQAEVKKLGALGPAMGVMLIVVSFLMSAKPF